MSAYFVYVLRNPKGTLYIGQTQCLHSRVRQHQIGEAGWTRSRGPWELIHYEEFSKRADAMRRERALKTGVENQKLRSRYAATGRAGPSLKD